MYYNGQDISKIYDLQEKLYSLEKENEDLETEEPIPSMPQNVLGLNHADIICRVGKSIVC